MKHKPGIVAVLSLSFAFVVSFNSVALGVSAVDLGDFVWEDLNADGIWDDGEPGINGVTVRVYSTKNRSPVAEIGTTITADHPRTGEPGYYLFTGLSGKSWYRYYLVFESPAGYEFTTQDAGTDDAVDSDTNPTTGQTALIDLSSLPAGQKFDFAWDSGLVRAAAISDYVWADANQNGLQDDGDTGISGVTVNLYGFDSVGLPQLLDTTVTDSDGYYLFDELAPGDYYIVFEAPDEFEFTTQDAGDDAADSDADTTTGETEITTLDSGETDLTWDAGLILPPEDIQIEKTGAEPTGNCKTIGFWKNNIKKHLQGKKRGFQVPKDVLLQWLREARVFYLYSPYEDVLPDQPDDALLEAAHDILSYAGSDIVQKTLKQLLACELNYVSGDYALTDVGAHEAFCMAVEDALQDPGPELHDLHGVCDALNNLGNASPDTTICVGDTLVFTITLTATLNSPRALEVRDYLDSSLAVLAISDGGHYVADGHYVVWNVPCGAGQTAKDLYLMVKVTSLPNGNGLCADDFGAGCVVSDPVQLTIHSQLTQGELHNCAAVNVDGCVWPGDGNIHSD